MRISDWSSDVCSSDLLDVVEHIDNDVAALRGMAECLAPGGKILIAVPAHQWMWSAHDVVNHHHRRYSKASLAKAIADAGPMTGQYASFGEQMKRGAEMAVADFNAAGGVLGKQLVLELGDDAYDPKQAVAVANDFASKGVVLVAGHFCSGSSIPASWVLAAEDVLQTSPGSTNPPPH